MTVPIWITLSAGVIVFNSGSYLFCHIRMIWFDSARFLFTRMALLDRRVPIRETHRPLHVIPSRC
jgi:hypothetical protein